MFEAVALAFGLAMDATAVAATRGVLGRRSEVVLLPLLFGAFQSGMALFGWLGARWGGKFVAAFDHWIAFGLLVLIGGKMLYEAWHPDEDAADPRGGALLFLGLAVATSIDAAAAGITLPALAVDPWQTIALIGVITAACSVLGFLVGRSAGARFGKRVEILGGLILIGLGVRVLVEHL